MFNANCISLRATERRKVYSRLTLSRTASHFPRRTEENYEYHHKAIFEAGTPDTKQEFCCALNNDGLESPFTRTIEGLFFWRNGSRSVKLTSSSFSSSSSSTAEDYNAYGITCSSRFLFVRKVRIIYVPVVIFIRHPVKMFGRSLSLRLRRTKLEGNLPDVLN